MSVVQSPEQVKIVPQSRTELRFRNAIYEIFVDRFAGNGGNPVAPDTSNGCPLHHCGGTFDGIRFKLDYIQKLGADAIYLTPIFKAASNHKYNASSFDEIDPGFGDMAAFEALAAECRRRDMGLILDGVFNHVGTDHEWFQRAQDGLEQDRFKFNGQRHQYDCWRGHDSLPELNHDNPDVRDALFNDGDSIIRKWLRRGATGWRLDCANDLGQEICLQVARAARAEGAMDGVIGEVMAYAEEWLQAGCLDGIMNYYFRETVLGLVTGEVPVTQAAYNFKRMARRYDRNALLHSWNVLATHDTPRLATVVPCPARRNLARVLACTFPGIPMIYYGEEAEMQGGADPGCRMPMDWENAKASSASASFIAMLSSLRRAHPALTTGAYLSLPQPGHPSLLAFARITEKPDEVVIVMANCSNIPFTGKVFVPYSHLFDGLVLKDLLNDLESVKATSGALTVTLPSWHVALFTPDDSVPGYSFFRGRG